MRSETGSANAADDDGDIKPEFSLDDDELDIDIEQIFEKQHVDDERLGVW